MRIRQVRPRRRTAPKVQTACLAALTAAHAVGEQTPCRFSAQILVTIQAMARSQLKCSSRQRQGGCSRRSGSKWAADSTGGDAACRTKPRFAQTGHERWQGRPSGRRVHGSRASKCGNRPARGRHRSVPAAPRQPPAIPARVVRRRSPGVLTELLRRRLAGHFGRLLRSEAGSLVPPGSGAIACLGEVAVGLFEPASKTIRHADDSGRLPMREERHASRMKKRPVRKPHRALHLTLALLPKPDEPV